MLREGEAIGEVDRRPSPAGDRDRPLEDSLGGVELIGPARAGLFINLIPVFGALMAVVVLGEPFGWAEIASAALVFGGIALAEKGRG